MFAAALAGGIFGPLILGALAAMIHIERGGTWPWAVALGIAVTAALYGGLLGAIRMGWIQ